MFITAGEQLRAVSRTPIIVSNHALTLTVPVSSYTGELRLVGCNIAAEYLFIYYAKNHHVKRAIYYNNIRVSNRNTNTNATFNIYL